MPLVKGGSGPWGMLEGDMSGILASVLGMTLSSASAASTNVEATLLTEHAAARPGRPFWVGVRLVMNPGWHTYWRHPGDSGLATRIEWTLPAGWQAGEIQWPLPSLFGDGTVKSYGYANEAMLAAVLRPPANAPKGSADITVKVSWLECEEICKPGKATLSLAVPVDPAPAQPSKDAPLFAAVRRLWPVASPPTTVTFESTADRVVVAWPAAWPAETAQFFPETAGVTEPSAEQIRDTAEKRARLTIARPAGSQGVPPGTTGVLVLGSRDSKKAYRVTVKP